MKKRAQLELERKSKFYHAIKFLQKLKIKPVKLIATSCEVFTVYNFYGEGGGIIKDNKSNYY